MKTKALVLMSGGLDSVVTLAEAIQEEREIALLHFSYGQRNGSKEGEAAGLVAAHYGLRLRVIDLYSVFYPLREASELLKTGALADDHAANRIPNTYVPLRNTVFLAIAGAHAETLGCTEIWVGFNYNDARGVPSPDGRLVYLRSMETTIALGSKSGAEGAHITLEAPFIGCSKAEMIARGRGLKAPLDLSWSCFDGKEAPCGCCSACKTREKALADARQYSRRFF